jgi:capsular polysaccharide biosynthesis protein
VVGVLLIAAAAIFRHRTTGWRRIKSGRHSAEDLSCQPHTDAPPHLNVSEFRNEDRARTDRTETAARMDLSSLYSLLKRRWLVVLPTALVVGVLLAVVVVLRPPTHRSSSTVVLLPPAGETKVASASNPFDRLNDISVVVDILRRIVSSDSTVSRLRAEGLRGDFTVAANVDFTRGPIIEVTAEAPSASDAIADAELVVRELARQLKSLQESQGTEQRYFITSQVVIPPTDATTSYSSVLRRLIVAIVLGIGVVIGAALVADTLDHRVGRRSRQREPSTAKSS